MTLRALPAFEPDGSGRTCQEFPAMRFDGGGGAFGVFTVSVGIGDVDVGNPVGGHSGSSRVFSVNRADILERMIPEENRFVLAAGRSCQYD